MVAAGILASATVMGAGLPARTKGLYLGGTDVLLVPGTSGNRTGVPIESVSITEQGPGGVSSMSFTIEDPTSIATVAEGMDVRFTDITNDEVDFLGWVQSFTLRPDFGNTGRSIDIVAMGVEAVLDWAVLNTDLVFPAASISTTAQFVQAIAGNATGLGPLNAGSKTGGSIQALPVDSQTASNTYAFTIPAGTPVRDAIRQGWQAVSASVITTPPSTYNATVDFTYGLRFFVGAGGSNKPSDYVNMTVVDTIAGTPGEDLQYAVDASGHVHAVFVRGTGAGIFATITDGTGLMGDVASINDTTLTTLAMVQDAGATYLAQFQTSARGSFHKIDWAPPISVHTSSLAIITDARAGLSATVFVIMQIDKTFNPSTRENWAVSFGGLPPSGARLIRRLTRGTLS